jgi:hypothetical protein
VVFFKKIIENILKFYFIFYTGTLKLFNIFKIKCNFKKHKNKKIKIILLSNTLNQIISMIKETKKQLGIYIYFKK